MNKKCYCKDCNKELNKRAEYLGTKRCNFCATKMKIKEGHYNKNNIGINSNFYIDGRTLKQYYCLDCGKKIHYNTYLHGSKRCHSCATKLYFKMHSSFGRGKNSPNYKDGRTNNIYYCRDCKKQISIKSGVYGSHRCRSCANQGINHPNYKDGKGREPYSLDFTSKLKAQIRKRDNYTCKNCGMSEEEHIEIYKCNLEIHHIDHNRINCKEDNLLTLCKKCNIRDNHKK